MLLGRLLRRVKARPGALSINTVEQRLAVLASWHRLQGWPSPTESSALKALVNSARKAQVRAGTVVRKKTAVVAEPLAAMLSTCTDGLRGTRDRALLLLGWSGGGRRRSELVGLQGEDLRQLDPATWLYRLGNAKTDSAGLKREKPCVRRPLLPCRRGSTKARSPLARCFAACIGAAMLAGLRSAPTTWRAWSSAARDWQGCQAIGAATAYAPATRPKPDARAYRWAM
jgi:integrase